MIDAKYVGKTGKVFSFEPELSNFKLLQKNVDTVYMCWLTNYYKEWRKTDCFFCNYFQHMHSL